MKIITKLVAISILLVVVGCASSRMTITEFDKDGNVTTVNEIESKVVGSRTLEDVDVNLKKGRVKIGSSEGSAGDLAEALKNLSEVAKKVVIP